MTCIRCYIDLNSLITIYSVESGWDVMGPIWFVINEYLGAGPGWVVNVSTVVLV